MRTINPGKAAISLGAATASLHLIWSVLVATGTAKAVVDFILMLHFMALDIQIEPFNIRYAVVLIGLTGAIGAAFGAILAWVWNMLAGEPRSSVSSDQQPFMKVG